MATEREVLIAGAGPVGLVAAANLVRHGIPVRVFEASPTLSRESRASTFHPPTLDFLDDLGFARPLIAQGLKAPTVQYRSKRDGVLGAFDFGAIADATRHPFRLQAEQFKLTRIIHDALKDSPLYRIEFSAPVKSAVQDESGVTVEIDGAGYSSRRGTWLIGADGARSAVRRSLDITFDGFTWPERFLVVTTPHDFDSHMAGLSAVTYIADPKRWHFLLRIPGTWRVMLPVPANIEDEVAASEPYARESLRDVAAELDGCRIQHITLYRVHQRVAATFRKGRAFLAGDAAHINNPLGGMGMNGGIHDAINLTDRLARVYRGEADALELDRYDRQRRLVTLEYVQTATIKNKRDLEAGTEKDRRRFAAEMRAAMADAQKARELLMRISMIASLRRAEELG